MSLHADVAVPACDRRRLERLSVTTWRGPRSRATASKSGPTDASRSASRPAGATEPPTS
jgi:hypothetical protein